MATLMDIRASDQLGVLLEQNSGRSRPLMPVGSKILNQNRESSIQNHPDLNQRASYLESARSNPHIGKVFPCNFFITMKIQVHYKVANK